MPAQQTLKAASKATKKRSNTAIFQGVKRRKQNPESTNDQPLPPIGRPVNPLQSDEWPTACFPEHIAGQVTPTSQTSPSDI
jgi:hypothetical protein